MGDILALMHVIFVKIGILGLAGLWALKITLGWLALRWVRLRRARA